MSALNDFYQNWKSEFLDTELDDLKKEFQEIVSKKFPNHGEVELEAGEEDGDGLYWFSQANIDVNGYEFIITGDNDGFPILAVRHNSNILGVHYPKNSSEFEDVLNEIRIN